MEKNVFFCPVCGLVQARDTAQDSDSVKCPFCKNDMQLKLSADWDAVPDSERGALRIQWVQQANQDQTFSVDLYNKRMADPAFQKDDSSGAPVPSPVAAPAPQPAAQPNLAAPAYQTPAPVDAVKGKGGFWIGVLKTLTWLFIIAFPIAGAIGGYSAVRSEWLGALVFGLAGLLLGLIFGAASMTYLTMAENVRATADNTAKILKLLERK